MLRRTDRVVSGPAADIFIDESPEDGVMDDLNREGVINCKDAAVLYEIVDGMFGVDVGGFRARWGN